MIYFEKGESVKKDLRLIRVYKNIPQTENGQEVENTGVHKARVCLDFWVNFTA